VEVGDWGKEMVEGGGKKRGKRRGGGRGILGRVWIVL